MSVDSLKAELKKKIIFLDADVFPEISEEEVTKLCKSGVCFKMKQNGLIGADYLTDHIYSYVKEKEYYKLDSPFLIQDRKGGYSCEISKSIIKDNLDQLVLKNLILKDDSHLYQPNLDKILSLEEVKNFCRYRGDVLSVWEIVRGFGFSCWEEVEPKNRLSNAVKHCQKVIDKLKTNKFLLEFPRFSNNDEFFWNSRYEEVV